MWVYIRCYYTWGLLLSKWICTFLGTCRASDAALLLDDLARWGDSTGSSSSSLGIWVRFLDILDSRIRNVLRSIKDEEESGKDEEERGKDEEKSGKDAEESGKDIVGQARSIISRLNKQKNFHKRFDIPLTNNKQIKKSKKNIPQFDVHLGPSLNQIVTKKTRS